MDLIVGYVIADMSIKEISLQDYMNKEEFFFNTFVKLACSAFNDVLKQNVLTKQENLIHVEEKKKKEYQLKKLTEELMDLKNKQENPKICEMCVAHEKDCHEFEQKYEKLEKQFKKCAFIINSSLDGDNKVLGRVREIVSQSVAENNNHQECGKAACLQAKPEHPKSFHTSNYPAYMEPLWSLDDDTSILAPSSPEENDVETQLFGGPGEDVVLCIPETVPFDCPKLGTTSQKFFKSKTCALSPIVCKKSSSKLSARKAVSPVQIQQTTPIKRPQVKSVTSLDDSVYSPPILNLASATRSSAFISPSNQCAEENCKTRKVIRPLVTKMNLQESNHPQQVSEKLVQPSLTEQQKTPTSQRNKSLKQTKLTLGRLASDVSTELPVAATVKTRMPTKTVRVSPTTIVESKRKRRGKDPEDWDCKECYKLFQKAVAAKKLDVRKMPVSMNFCDVHFNRYSYYLNTPPNFWDCDIGKPPRNGHLHPLDASAAQDDDDDFL